MQSLLDAIAERPDVLRLACLTPVDVDLGALKEHFTAWHAVNSGALAYVDSRRDQLIDPFGTRPWAKAALIIAFAPCAERESPLRQLPLARPGLPAALIAPYALHEDYHRTGRRILAEIAAWLTAMTGNSANVSFEACVDTRPVLEKLLAEQAGLGQRAPNTLLRIPPWACQAHLAILFTSLTLPSHVLPQPCDTLCQSCQACLEACPNSALTASGLDVRLCRAWVANEKRGPLSPAEQLLLGNSLFGCPFCTMACPDTPPGPPPFAVDPKAILAMTNAALKKIIAGTALQHLGPSQLKRNAKAVIENQSLSPKEKIIREFL